MALYPWSYTIVVYSFAGVRLHRFNRTFVYGSFGMPTIQCLLVKHYFGILPTIRSYVVM